VLRKWFGPRALSFHALLILITSACLIAGWWQLHQALKGNTLSWAYTVEWPIFAIIALVGWWQLVTESPEDRAARADRARREHEEVVAADPVRPVHPGAEGMLPRDHAEAEQALSVTQAARIAVAAAREYELHVAKTIPRDESRSI
jgi:hypothetical protein